MFFNYLELNCRGCIYSGGCIDIRFECLDLDEIPEDCPRLIDFQKNAKKIEDKIRQQEDEEKMDTELNAGIACRISNPMDLKAQEIVAVYVGEHLDATDPVPTYDIYTVWKTRVLQNYKFLISTSLPDGMYYEVTYNGDKDEWYMDAYKKFENCVIKGNKNEK